MKILREIVAAVTSQRTERRRRERVRQRNRERLDALLGGRLPIRLDLGAGGNRLQGWTSCDCNGWCDLEIDLTEPFPFPDDSVAEIYSSHVLEHFLYPQPLLAVLAESRRVLQPGGRIRIAVPDAAIYLDAYAHPERFDRERYILPITGLTYRTRIDYVNYMAYMAGTHRHLFDRENLPVVLEEAGFREVRLREFEPEVDIEGRRYETIYAQGMK